MGVALPFSNLYSHPGKPLERHLLNVAAIALHNFSEEPVEMIGVFRRETLAKLILLSSLSHDLGKATSFFQEYLNAGEKEKNLLKNKTETRHGLLSAIVVFYAVKSALQAINEPPEEYLLLAFAAFMAVRRHHGNLDEALAESFLSSKDKEVLLYQAGSIDKKNFSLLMAHLYRAGFNLELEPKLLGELINGFPSELLAVRRQIRKIGRREDLSLFYLVNYLFSHLVDADKNEASLGQLLPRKEFKLSSKLVKRYKESAGLEPTPINELREEAFREVMGHPLDLKKHLYSLNLPTGLGKTLTSFSFALKLREKIGKEFGYLPRIIYCLPFLSVIEQNAAILDEVCRASGYPVESTLLLKHHHLADYTYKKDDDEFSPEEAKILIEGWNSEIVITTFVQFFHTLVSNRNRALLKFHRFSGSIIILDEVQSIPFGYWLLVKNMLQKLCCFGNAYVMLVTATEPLIFEREEVVSLVKKEKYFSQMNRVVVKPRLEEDLTLDEFGEKIKIQDGKSYLFILNTVQSAKEFYDILAKKTKEEIILLTTHIIPYERLERIVMLREKKVRLAISTQLVEAGVDLDFDVVYRDMAPLDAINQAAGRCNRHGDRAGEVIVVSLTNEGESVRRRYASYIYDPILLGVTRSFLEQKDTIPEKKFLDLIQDYYEELQQRKSNDTSKKLLAALYQLKYQKKSNDDTPGVSDFKLIVEDYPKIDVFIEYNEDAANVWEKYVYIKGISDLIQRRSEFNKIKADFYKYTVAIPVNVENIPPEVAGFRYVNRNSLPDYYNLKTGFKTEGELLLW